MPQNNPQVGCSHRVGGDTLGQLGTCTGTLRSKWAMWRP